MLGAPTQFSLPGGPQIGQPSNVLDIDPLLDKSCARYDSGTYCKGTTSEARELFEDVQRMVEQAAVAIGLLHTPLKVDGVIGPETADLATQVLMQVPAEGRVKVWLSDARSVKRELMAPLLAAQPQYAIETFEEIAKTGGQPQPVVTPTPTPVPSPTPAPTPKPAPTPAPAVPPPKKFWTRRKKIVAVAGAGVLTVGLVALYFYMRSRSVSGYYGDNYTGDDE